MIPRKPSLLLAGLAGFTAMLALACGGDSDPPPSGGGDREIVTELSGSSGLDDTVIGLDMSVDTTYYEVEGTTTESIFNHIERNGPTDGDGKRGSGLTSVVWGYEWQGGAEGGDCTIRSMTIKAGMVVTLPRHVDEGSLPEDIRDNWDVFAESVATHEQTHVDIYENGAQSIRERMLALDGDPSCDGLEAEIERVWSEAQAGINNQQAEFHQQEFDRLAQKRAPIGQQIDENRALINTLQTQIRALDDEIADLRGEVDALSIEIADLDAEIKAINDSNEPQADKQAKLVVLVQQRNALQARHNEVADDHNEALAQRDALVVQHSQLIDETNELVDAFNWTR